MKSLYNALSLILVLSFFSNCDFMANDKKKEYVTISPENYISSGGNLQGKILCPMAVNDVIVELDSLKLDTGNEEPEMTARGMMIFMKKNNITTIKGLLNALPKHYRNNFSLVEHTKGEGQSSLKYPRIVLFGSDGTFLMNISTKPDDPKHDLLDFAILSENDGTWDFSQFDFTGSTPKLHVKPESCIRCHGDNPRPVWGTNMDWPGVFGDNEAAGPNGEALSFRHAERMNEIKEGKTFSDRFDFLEWSDQKLTSGGIRRIANHAFGAELLVSNMAMGTATGRGVFIRMKKGNKVVYKQIRGALLLLGYEYMINGILSRSDKERITTLVSRLGGKDGKLHDIFHMLEIDPEESFSLGTLAKEETPKTDWSIGAGDLYEQIFLMVLHDLAQEDEQLRNILLSVPNTPGVFGCDNLGSNIMEVVDFKMLHMHQLLGKERYAVHKVYYPQDAENIKEKVFIPIYDKLAPYLKSKI